VGLDVGGRKSNVSARLFAFLRVGFFLSLLAENGRILVVSASEALQI